MKPAAASQAAAVDWTPSQVERRLIAAFARLPSFPVYGVRRRLQPVAVTRDAGRFSGSGSEASGLEAKGFEAKGLAETLGWVALLDADPDGRKYLWAWARCRASDQSFGALCHAMGWSRSSAEAGRRRAAKALARTLARGSVDKSY